VAEKSDKLAQMARKLKDENKGYPAEQGTISPEAQQQILQKYRAETFTARDLELLKGISNAAYHYRGSAKIMAQIGKAFAEATVALIGARKEK
jgi:hypothetical protein